MCIRKLIYILVKLNLLILPNIIISQDLIDSLNEKLSGKSDKEKVSYLLNQANYYLNVNKNASYELSKLAYEIAVSSKNNNLIVNAGLLYGKTSRYLNKLNESKEVLINVLNIFEKVNHKEGIAIVNNELGLTFKELKDYQNAINCFNKSLEYYNEINDKKNINIVSNNLASAYLNAKKFKEAINIYLELKTKAEQDNNLKDLANYLNQIGVAYSHYGDISSAKSYFNQAISVAEKIGDKKLLTLIETNLNNLSKLEEVKITEYEKEKRAEEEVYIKKLQEDVEESKKIVLKSLEEIEKLSYENQAKELKLHYIQNQLEKQLLENKIKEQNLKILKIENERRKIELLRQKEAIENQRKILIMVISASFILLILSLLIFRLYSINKRTLRIVYQQKEQIEQQKNELSRQNKIITESINYAKYIQFGFLPPERLIKKHFKDFFLFFKPRDIVSGDFYWFYSNENIKIISVIDCTGHGVPGAFMTLITNTLLNKIIKEQKIYTPSKILYELNNNVLDTFSTAEDFDFGLDITMCCYDLNKNTLTLSLAGHNCLLIDKNEVKEIDGLEYYIGGGIFAKRDVEYKDFVFNLNNEDLIGIFYSDGFIDQIGGENNKKLGSKAFKNKIIDFINNSENFSQITEKLDTFFNEWKKENKQVDDIIVVGVKF